MRYHRMRFDIWLCLLLAVGVSLGTAAAARAAIPGFYERYAQAHTAADGDIGSKAGAEVFRAQSVDDLLSHDTFTVISPGIEYRNRGSGYYGGRYLQALTLPSGELVAAWINGENVQETGGYDYYSSDKILPLGRVVYEDLTQNQTFLQQIEFKEPLTRTDFYVDMTGAGGKLSQEDFSELPVMAVQLATVLIFFPIFHSLGAKLGIFPRFFVPRRKKDAPETEWE